MAFHCSSTRIAASRPSGRSRPLGGLRRSDLGWRQPTRAFGCSGHPGHSGRPVTKFDQPDTRRRRREVAARAGLPWPPSRRRSWQPPSLGALRSVLLLSIFEIMAISLDRAARRGVRQAVTRSGSRSGDDLTLTSDWLTSKWSRRARRSVRSCRCGARLIWTVRRLKAGTRANRSTR